MSNELELEDLELLLGSEAPPLDLDKKEASKRGEGIRTASTTLSSDILLSNIDTKENVGEKHRREKKKKRREKKQRKRSRHEAEDEDESEEEEDAKDRRPRSKYVLDEAESSSAEDSFIEDDEDGEEGGFRPLVYQPPPSRERGEGEGRGGAAARASSRGNIFFEQDGNHQLTDEELGRQYEERARWMKEQRKVVASQRRGRGGPGDGTEDGNGFIETTIPRHQLTALRYTSQMLPKPSDPKVYAIKCKPRMARILVGRIVNKCYAYRMGINLKQKMDLGILSVFSLDHVKEYIYVEAYRQSFVTNALEGFVGIFRFTITQVSPTELLQMLEKRPNDNKVLVGELVRLRQFPYRGDVGQVVSVLPDARHVVVKVVPREDFLGKAYQKTTTVLPQRFFAPEKTHGAVERGNHIQWGELKFDHDGYLLKTVSIRSIIHGKQLQPPPGSEELTTFYRHNRELVKEAVGRYALEGSQMIDAIRIGDTVRVVSGELKDTVGTVINLLKHMGTAVLRCSIPRQKEPISLRVELCDCTKHFQEGTHVVVEDGPYRGRSGTVVKSYGETVTLFCDRNEEMQEITVKANDCYQSKLVASYTTLAPVGLDKGKGSGGMSSGVGGDSPFGDLALYDLVRLVHSRSVGCITLFHEDQVDVLTEDNEYRHLTYAQVTPIGRGSRKAVDIYQNVLERGGEVTIRDTDLTPFRLAGSSGRIEHVFNEMIFVRFPKRKDYGGLVAMPASCVLLTGGRKSTITDTTGKRMRALLPSTVRKAENAVAADYSSSAKGDTFDHNSEYVGDSESYY